MRGTFLWLAALLPVTLAPRGLGNPRSQGYHDERLQRIFTALGVADDSSSTFVEFGWYFEWGSNTAALLRRGWTGFMMDGVDRHKHDRSKYHLHQTMITSANIVGLFQQHNVSTDVTYVSIDLDTADIWICLLYTSPSPRDGLLSRMPSSA